MRVVSYTLGLDCTSAEPSTLTRPSDVMSEELSLVQLPTTVIGMFTAGLNSALPVRMRRSPVWNPSSIGDPVMVREGGGTEGEETTVNTL